MLAEVLVTVSGIVRDLAVALLAGALVTVAVILPPTAGVAPRRRKAHAALATASHPAVDPAADPAAPHPAVTRTLALARGASVVWVVAAATYVIASAAAILRISPTDPLFGAQLWQFVTQISLGQSYLNALGCAVVASLAVAVVRGPTLAAWALVPVAVGLAWQAQTGHAAGAANHHLAVTAMLLHLSASALWLGLLVTMAAVRRHLGASGPSAVRRMSRTAIWAAWGIVISGVANAALRLGSPAEFFTTRYGQLMLAKAVLMAGAIALAGWHRRVTLPRLTQADVRERFWRVLWVDVALLVAVVCIAGVLSRTAPPVDLTPLPNPTPALLLTGYPLPPATSLVTWLTLWRVELLTAVALTAAAVMYLRWVWRLRRRGDAWSPWRTASWLGGLALLVWVTQGAPAVYSMVIFSGHMVEHMMLVMMVPLPLTFGAPVTLALRALPARKDGSRGAREWLRALIESRWMRLMAHPIVAAVNFAASMVVFYYTPLFQFSLTNHAAHLWMVVHFTVAGYLFANSLFGIDPGPQRAGYLIRLVTLFATMAFHAFFSVALSSSPILLAPRWYGLMGRTWGPDAITDQQYGGTLAWGLGEIPVVLLAIIVLVQWRGADTRETRRKDRQADHDDDAELRAYNARLASIAREDGVGVSGGV